jgi:hypothetical protein
MDARMCVWYLERVWEWYTFMWFWYLEKCGCGILMGTA